MVKWFTHQQSNYCLLGTCNCLLCGVALLGEWGLWKEVEYSLWVWVVFICKRIRHVAKECWLQKICGVVGDEGGGDQWSIKNYVGN